jgi:hypothetical protein
VNGIKRPDPAAVLLFGTMTSPLAMFPPTQLSFRSLWRSVWTSEARIPLSSEIRSNCRRAGERLALAAAINFVSSPALYATNWHQFQLFFAFEQIRQARMQAIHGFDEVFQPLGLN